MKILQKANAKGQLDNGKGSIKSGLKATVRKNAKLAEPKRYIITYNYLTVSLMCIDRLEAKNVSDIKQPSVSISENRKLLSISSSNNIVSEVNRGLMACLKEAGI